jgi:protein TonB
MKFLFLFCLLFIFYSSFSQKEKEEKESFYVFDKDWKGTTIENAVYMIYKLRLDDTTFQWNYYNFFGPLLYIETYKSDDSEIAHGYHAWFSKTGSINSSGYYYNGKKNRDWYYFNDSMSPQRIITYANGNIVKEWQKKNDSVKNDGPADPNEKEAEFKNGPKGWKNYLIKNLNYPARAQGKDIHGTVTIKFIVDKEGKVVQPQIIKSVEFSLDQEVIRILQQSPAWKPGFQFGKFVNSFHTQPITF